MKNIICLTITILLFSITSILAQQTPRMISGGVINGKAVTLPKPEKSAAAEAVNACGSVSVSIIIDTDGNVISAQAVSGHPLLKGTAVDAARRAKFITTYLSGEAVKVSGIIVYVFKCGDENDVSGLELTPEAEDEAIKMAEKTPAKQSDNSVKSINGGVVNGRALSLPKPEYPASAAAVGAKGTVKVEIIIDEGGNIISANAVSGHPLLRQTSEQAAMQARFSPTRLEGQPVKVSGVIVYNFGEPEDVSELEKKMFFLGLGAFLTANRYMPAEDWEIFTDDELNDVPEWKNELQPLTTITKTTGKMERNEIFDKVLNSLQNKATGENKWQLQFGKTFGELMSEFLKKIENPEIGFDPSVIKTKLLQMDDLLLSAPKDFPPELLPKFKELTQLGKEKEFATDENFEKIVKTTMEIFEIISPNGKIE